MRSQNEYEAVATPAGVSVDFPGIAASDAEAILATAIFLSGDKASVRKDMLDKLIRAGLPHEDDLDSALKRLIYGGLVVAPHDKAVARLADRYPNGSFNTRQLIKLIGVDAAYLLAATGCHPKVGAWMLTGYILDGNFVDWIKTALPGGAWKAACEVETKLGGKSSLMASAALDARATLVGLGALPASMANAAPITPTPHQPHGIRTPLVIDANAIDGAPAATQQGVQPMNTTTPAIDTLLLSIPAPLQGAIDAMLNNSGAPGVSIATLASAIASGTTAKGELDASIAEVKCLQAKLRKAAHAAPVAIQSTQATLPNGKMAMVQASSVFPEMSGLNLEIPSWSWDHPHPHVPAAIDGYIFRRPLLARALRALASGEGLWLRGHTGTGKTTFILQIAARLNWPVMRVAMDAAVDRSEIVGRSELVADGKGGTQSKWLPGVIERSIPNAYIVLFDELDAAHPNSVYTLQPVFEREGLTLLEDGGRIVPFHPMTRLCATGNTAGNGDETGLYPACRILTAATLDRFPEFIEVPYLDVDEEEKLVRANTGLKQPLAKKLAKFAKEMRAAFVSNEIPVSYSPRRSIAFARAVEDYMSMLPAGVTQDSALALAIHGKLLQAMPSEHRARLTEIARTCLGLTIDADRLDVPGLADAAPPPSATKPVEETAESPF